MSKRLTTVLAWLPLAIGIAEILGYFYFTIPAARMGVQLAKDDLRLAPVIIPGAVVLGIVGGFVASRRPRNPIGWLFALAIPIVWLKGLTDGIVFYTHYARNDEVPGGVVAAWMSAWDYIPAVGALGGFVFLLFPDGRLPSRRWAPVAWLAGIGVVSAVVNSAFFEGPLSSFPDISNPYPAPSWLQGPVKALGAGIVLLPTTFLAGVASLVVRARSGSPVLRSQVKWVAYAGTFFAIAFASTLIFGFTLVTATLVFGSIAMLAVASAIAIMRYRLFEIDRLISRTLSYAFISAFLAGLFVLVAVVPTAVVGAGGRTPDWLVAVATLIVAAMFRPVRRRVQSAVDHRFNRGRYDAARTIEAFAARLREEVDIDTVGAELTTVVSETMRPAHATLWLRRVP